MPTKTVREIENKLEEIKYNFLNYNWVHTKEYMYDFLVTKPMLALLEEARQHAREEVIDYISQNQWWEDSEDMYREHFWLSPKYK